MQTNLPERDTTEQINKAVHLLLEVVEASPRPALMARRVVQLVSRKLMRAAGAVEVTLDWR